MSRIDRVNPLRRYRAAKYPSHADPDPTTYPAPVEFPFHRELVRAVAGFGIAASLLGFGPEVGALQDAEKPKFENPKNPFPLKRSGLPHMTSPYGTGQPSYLADEGARRVIDQAFKDEGFALEGLKYEKDGVAFRTSGFDPKHRIGYVYGTWKNLDEDAIVNWMQQPQRKGLAPEAETPEGIRSWMEGIQWGLRSAPKPLQDEAARILAMKDGPGMMEPYKKFYKDWHDELLSLEEAKKLETELPKKKEFVAVISQFDVRHIARMGETQRDTWTKLVIDAETDPKAKEQLRLEFEALAKDQLKLLERNVREYIAWARTQGLQ